MSVFAKGLITVVSCSLLFAILAIPLILRKVPRNVVYGYRTRATLADDRVWYDANAHFGRGLLIASLLSAAVIFVLYRSEALSPQMFFNVSMIVLVAPALIAALATARYIRTL